MGHGGCKHTLQGGLVIQQLAETDQPDIVWTAGLCLPLLSPLAQDELFEFINAQVEGVTFGQLDVPFGQVLAVQLEGMSSA